MKLHKVLLFLLVLPLTLVLDFILYSFTKSCPTCGSFAVWLETEGALSFPIVVGLSEWVRQIMTSFRPPSRNPIQEDGFPLSRE